MKRAVVVILCSALVAGGCGSAATTTEPAPPPTVTAATMVPVVLKVKKLRKQTEDASVAIRGTSDSNAEVTVNGKPARVNDIGVFKATAKLKVGANEIEVRASADGAEATSKTLKVKRVEPPPPAPTETAPPAAPEASTPPGYPAPGECGVSPETGDPVCANEDGTLELDTQALQGGE